MQKLLSILLMCFLSLVVCGEERYRFRVYLKDKGTDGFRIEEPQAFLSQEAIIRRMRRGIAITENDFPISRAYLTLLSQTGATPVVKSKWFATVVMESTDSIVINQLKQLSFVDSVQWIWKGVLQVPEDNRKKEHLVPQDPPLQEPYGYAKRQIHLLNGERLHQAGFQGEGMRIAVIDAGFLQVDQMAAFDSLRLIGTHNILFPGKSIFIGDDHGTKVLSCLAAYLPGIMIGTAPKASYLLLKSEDSNSEFPVEEDYWTAAVEYADSVGVDVISSSLGYFAYDTPHLSYNQTDLTGKKSLISLTAQKASEKGLLLFCSAGNEGNSDWGKITFPADAAGICTVGSITEKKKKSVFSSIGPSADGRIKPDAVALGTGSCVIAPDGNIRYANGTSFSTPILAGLGTCLWQALPWLSNRELIDVLHRYSHLYKHPNAQLGYGIPDVYKAYKKEKKNGLQSK